jgi:hypothetical protein
MKVAGEHKLVTYGEWARLIKENFERCYYVPAGGLHFFTLAIGWTNHFQIPPTTPSTISALTL